MNFVHVTVWSADLGRCLRERRARIRRVRRAMGYMTVGMDAISLKKRWIYKIE